MSDFQAAIAHAYLIWVNGLLNAATNGSLTYMTP